MYFPVSPNPYSDSSEEDAFCKIFSPKLEQGEIIDDFDEDVLYFNQVDVKENNKNAMTFEDFDQCYRKFTEKEDINIIQGANCENPSFFVSLGQEKIFSSFENENIVKILNPEADIIKLDKSQCSKNEKFEKNDKIKDQNLANIKIMDIEKIGKNKFVIEIEENDSKNNKEENTPSKNNNNGTNYNSNKNNKFKSIVKQKSIKNKKPENAYFPFTQGKGILYCMKLFDESNSSPVNNLNLTKNQSQETNFTLKLPEKNKAVVSEDLASNYKDEENLNYSGNLNDDCLFKFTTKKYFIAENGRRKKIKRNRKFKSDDIRKKIKSRFHKTFKNVLNKKLKEAGSELFFDFFPQCFIGNITKKLNYFCLELTFKELLLTDFISLCGKKDSPSIKVDNKKYLKNKEVLEYLENNPEISKKSGFNLIKVMKYKDLLKNYFNSAEFEDSIVKLKKENENKDYALDYVIKAKKYIDYFSSYEKDGSKEESCDSNNL